MRSTTEGRGPIVNRCILRTKITKVAGLKRTADHLFKHTQGNQSEALLPDHLATDNTGKAHEQETHSQGSQSPSTSPRALRLSSAAEVCSLLAVMLEVVDLDAVSSRSSSLLGVEYWDERSWALPCWRRVRSSSSGINRFRLRYASPSWR